MRNALLILASCGLVGLSLKPAAAGDATVLVEKVPTASAASSSTTAGHPAAGHPAAGHPAAGQPGAGAAFTDPISTSAAGHADKHPNKDSNLVHAEYVQDSGATQGRKIQQISGQEPASLFDDAADGPGTKSTHRGTGASPLARGKTRKLSPARTGLGQLASNDPSETPAVSLHWVKKSNFTVGQECSCDLVVKNAGKGAATRIEVDAFFPSTVRLTRAEPMPTDNQDHVTWSVPSLAPGEERTIHLKLIPSLRGDLPTAAAVRFTHGVENAFNVEEPLLSLTVHGPKDLLVGDSATQSITVSNPGTGVAHDVVVEARVSKGLEHPHSERLTIPLGSLNPGETRQVRIPLVAVAGGDQTVAIRASAGTDLHQDVVNKIHVIAPSIKVALDGPGLRFVGCKAAYAVTVRNDGGAPLTNVRVTHKLPEGFRFIRADKGGEYDDASRTITWLLNHLEASESAHVKVELATTEIGNHLHAVAAVSEQGAHSEARLQTVVDGTASLEVEIINLNDPVEVRTETAYEIHVRNEGSKAASNVAITCEIPAAIEMLRSEGATPGRNDQGVLTFRPLSELDAGKTAIYRVYVKGIKEGNHRFRVRLSADSIKEPLVRDEMTRFYAE